MGGYYKLKKILIILCITLTTLRIINNSKVFASESIEVTPTWNDGNYTYLADNNYQIQVENQIYIQNQFIAQLYNFYNWNNGQYRNNAKSIVNAVYAFSTNGHRSFTNDYQTVLYFFVNSNGNYCFEMLTSYNFNNIVYQDATLNNGYKISNVPFFSYARGSRAFVQVNDSVNATYTRTSSGNALVPCAQVGCYSDRWIDLFAYYGLIADIDNYNSVLNSIEETNELNYTQNYYTNQAVSNTYTYITNDNIDTISNLGFSQPNNSEDIDLTDCFDELEALLTGENYSNKSFTFSIPGNRNYTFSIAPTMLETNLTRVGGSAIISIIHAMWYIGLFGWYIFAYLGIWGKFLSGDWLHLVNHTSPVNKIVKMSVSTFGGGS